MRGTEPERAAVHAMACETNLVDPLALLNSNWCPLSFGFKVRLAMAGNLMESEKTKESLCSLRLSQIPGEWAESLWDGNFCGEDVTLPYEAVEESVLLNEDSWESLVDACAHWPHAVTSELGWG